MNDFVHKPGHGSLHRNDRGDNPNRPSWKGTITLEDGTRLKLAGWLKEGKNQQKYLSLAVEQDEANV